MLVKYNPQGNAYCVVPIIHPGSESIGGGSQVQVFHKGYNEITVQEWQFIKPLLIPHIKKRLFEVVGDKEPKSLKDIKTERTGDIIDNCTNEATIRHWFKTEDRESVRMKLIQRCEVLNIERASLNTSEFLWDDYEEDGLFEESPKPNKKKKEETPHLEVLP
jgi:hypothetical protein